MSAVSPSSPAPLILTLTLTVTSVGCVLAPAESDTGERTGEAELAIEGGAVDSGDRGVVGVAIYNEDGRVFATCSGTLIAPSVVLTAQHCVASTTRFVSCHESVFGPAMSPAQLAVTIATSMWDRSSEWIPVVDVVIAPGALGVCGRDLALLVLGQRADDRAQPLEPRLDRAVEVDEVFAGIGYGITSIDGSDAGLRRRRDALRVVCAGEGCDSHQIDGSEWRGDHGICSGDSGGPAVDRKGRVIGVTSRGPAGCDDPVYGGFRGFEEWLRSAALRASRDGGFTPPAWADDPDTLPPEFEPSGCSASARPAPLRAPWALVALAVLLRISARRNRARGAGAARLG